MGYFRKYDILLVGGSFPQPFGGGSINYVYNVFSSIDKRRVYVLTADSDHEANVHFDDETEYAVQRTPYLYHVLNTVKKPKWRSTFELIPLFFVMLRTLLKARPKVVCITEFYYFIVPLLALLSIFRVKVLCFMYAEEMTQLSRSYSFNKGLFRWLFDRSDIIITVSDYTSGLVLSFGDYQDKIRKIIPSVAVKKVVRAKDVNEEKIRILTVARLEERKGHIKVIEALAQLRDKYSNFEYLIAGGGSYGKIIEDAIRKNNADGYVRLLGRVSDEELSELYATSDIFVMPHMELANGDTEGCPTVFLEASYNGLPVVGGMAGGVSDAIKHGETGFIVDPLTNQLKDALEKLVISEPLRKEMGQKGSLYASQFIVENQSCKFIEIIDNLIKS